MESNTKYFSLLVVLIAPLLLLAQPIKIIVDAIGKGNFKTIQDAINSIPDSAAQDRVIYIKDGIYPEHLYVGKHHIILQGESKEKTIITGSIASLIYSCEHPGDKYSGIVNLDGDDITLMDLTIENKYGLNAPDSVFIDCINNTTKQPEKVKVTKTGHQFALRTFKSTRLKVIRCIIKAWGNDTVSPWNGETGMYYFKDCIMEGGTDFYCPRGWSYAENCTFVNTVPGAAAIIWHDGSKDRNMKSVLKNCNFKGTTPYKLGRYHHEASFYLIGCSFDKNLADLAIYKAATAKEMFWDSKAYYFNCRTEGKKFDWLNNNLDAAQGSPKVETITVQWTFDGRWNPGKPL